MTDVIYVAPIGRSGTLCGVVAAIGYSFIARNNLLQVCLIIAAELHAKLTLPGDQLKRCLMAAPFFPPIRGWALRRSADRKPHSAMVNAASG